MLYGSYLGYFVLDCILLAKLTILDIISTRGRCPTKIFFVNYKAEF